MPVTGHRDELRVKHENQAGFVAMSRDHVTEEDVLMFTRVQELSAQVSKHGKCGNFRLIIRMKVSLIGGLRIP